MPHKRCDISCNLLLISADESTPPMVLSVATDTSLEKDTLFLFGGMLSDCTTRKTRFQEEVRGKDEGRRDIRGGKVK